ncbi:MAG: hypothetical protein ACFE9Z_09555 [Promethearchaeota archaeon]
MGINVFNNNIHVVKNEVKSLEDFVNISDLIIPFSEIFKKITIPDIHSEEEILPFKKRDPKFQEILYSEFIFDE